MSFSLVRPFAGVGLVGCLLVQPVRSEAAARDSERAAAESVVIEADATVTKPDGDDFFQRFSTKFSRGDFSLITEGTRRGGETGVTFDFEGRFSSVRLGFAGGAPLAEPGYAKLRLGRQFGRADVVGTLGVEGGAPLIDFTISRAFDTHTVSIEASHSATSTSVTIHIEYRPRF